MKMLRLNVMLCLGRLTAQSLGVSRGMAFGVSMLLISIGGLVWIAFFYGEFDVIVEIEAAKD